MAAKGKASMAETNHPGTAIESKVLDRYGLTQDQLALLTGVSRRTINQLVNIRRNLTADMALRIAKVTGTSARDWLFSQLEWDLAQASKGAEKKFARIKTLPDPSAKAKAKPAAKATVAPKKVAAKPAVKRAGPKKAAKPAAFNAEFKKLEAAQKIATDKVKRSDGSPSVDIVVLAGRSRLH
jgi:addiction module HigA family antidote